MSEEKVETTEQQSDSVEQKEPIKKEVPKADGALAKMKEKLTRQRDEAVAKLAEYEIQAKRAESLKEVDIKKNDEAWQQKFKEAVTPKDERIKKLERVVANQHLDAVISEHAQGLTLPQYFEIGKMLLKERLGVTLDDKGAPKIIVKDKDGEVSKDSIDDIVKQLRKNKEYAVLFKGKEVGSGSVSLSENKPAGKNMLNPEYKRNSDTPRILAADPAKVIEYLKAKKARG